MEVDSPAASIPARRRYNELPPDRFAVFFSAAVRNVSPLKSVVSCHVVQRYEYIQCRVEPQLRARLNRLRDERLINVSAWLRRVISEALDREFPAPEPDPIPGWNPHFLPDSSWGAVFNGNAAQLPAQLVGHRITITATSTKESWTAAVIDVVERSAKRVVVRRRDFRKPVKGATP